MSARVQLPLEVILMIIKQADYESAINWSLATEGNAFLHKEALIHRWRDTYICAADLAAAPGEYESDDEADYSARIIACGKLGKANRHPRSKLSQAARAAQYIRSLYFDLRPSDIRYPGAYPSGYDADEPTYQTAEYSAQTLLPQLTKLDSLVLDGCVSDEVLALVPACRQLTVRLNFTAYPFRGKEIPTQVRDGSPPLRWEMNLPCLETLIVGELTLREAPELAKFIGSLTSLRTLHVNVRFTPAPLFERRSEPSGPLYQLLDHLALRGPHRRLLTLLPPSCKSLTLIDNYFLQDNRVKLRPKPTSYNLFVALEELHTQLEDPASTYNLLTWMPKSRLQRLSISAGCKNLFNDCFDDINKVVKAHQETLQEIRLTNVWYAQTNIADRFNMDWDGHFAITDLVLAMNDVQAYAQDDLFEVPQHDTFNHQQQNPEFRLYHLGLFSYEPERWGKKLERLALEAFDIERTKLNGIEEPDLAALRILILCPRGLNMKKQYPAPLPTFAAGKLALEIAKLGPSTLRYLIIGKDSFWIKDRDIIYVADASPETRGEISSWMNEHDKAFIDPDSRINAPRKGRFIQTPDPDYSLVTGWNFMVARRVTRG